MEPKMGVKSHQTNGAHRQALIANMHHTPKKVFHTIFRLDSSILPLMAGGKSTAPVKKLRKDTSVGHAASCATDYRMPRHALL